MGNEDSPKVFQPPTGPGREDCKDGGQESWVNKAGAAETTPDQSLHRRQSVAPLAGGGMPEQLQ